MGAPHGRGRFAGLSGTDHLGTEAVVAYVDGELSVGAHQRASGHLAGCEQCTLDVHAQQQARAALRTSGPVSMPSSLLGALCRIPDAWDDGGALRGATPGQPLAVDVSVAAGTVVFSAHSGYVAVLRPDDWPGDAPAPTPGSPTGPTAGTTSGSTTGPEAGQRPTSDGNPASAPRRGSRRILPFVVVAVSATAGLLVAQPAARVPAPPVAAPLTSPAPAGAARDVRSTTTSGPADADFTAGGAP